MIGFYGRYLGASGYALVLEFSPKHAQDLELQPILWRVDARPEGVKITFPRTEGDVYSQLGAYLDLREGWSWLLEESIKAEALITAEVEPGYLIGVRPGDPLSEEDPADREDPEIEEVFSRFDVERFDTLEFLNGHDSDGYPFQSERYHSWLSSELGAQLETGQFEAFVLSQSQKFFEAIEEVAEKRKVEVTLSTQDSGLHTEEEGYEERPLLKFKRGPLSITRDFSLPYLWTLHSGRQHYEGAVEFFRDDLERLYSGSELFFRMKRLLEDSHGLGILDIYIEDDDQLIIREAKGARRKWVHISLSHWADEGLFEGKEGAERFLRLLGWTKDPPQWQAPQHSLEQCALCEQEARLTRVLRPRFGQAQPKTIGMRLRDQLPEQIWGYYAMVCPQHFVPVFWSKGELLHQHLEKNTHQIVDIKTALKFEVNGLSLELLWGDELAGYLLNQTTKESLRERGALFAYAVTPDLIVLSLLPIQEELRQSIEPKIAQVIAQFGPDRDWRLEWSTPLK